MPSGNLPRMGLFCALLLACWVSAVRAQSPEPEACRGGPEPEACRHAIEQAQCSLLEAHHAISSTRALVPLALELKRANPYLHDRHIAEVLCHDFTGRGQKDMVVFVADGAQVDREWLVFRRRNTGWRLVFRHKTRAVDLGLVPDGIEEWEPIFLPNDPDCCPSGGETYRLFRWNGQRFDLSATKKIAPSASPSDRSVPGTN
jgi:hypothetical protein